MNVRRNISALNDFATKRVVKQFATKYHLVYFGRVDSQEDEHQLVRGVTVSTSHADSHYTVGTIDGHDIIFVQRRNTVTFPGKPSVEYKWLILQVDLAYGGLPHIFIDAHHHDETFYANLFVKVPQFQDMTRQIDSQGRALDRYFKVFAQPNHFAEASAVLAPQVTSTLAQHFHQFDYEISDDHLYVYASNSIVTIATLTEMLRAGAWLAGTLNALKIPA